jgi:hypothetical protein
MPTEKKTIPRGNDPALTLNAAGGADLALCHWDLWMCLLAQRDFEGDLARLGDDLRARRDAATGMLTGSRDEWKAMLSHLRDLQRRLCEAGADVAAVIAAAGEQPAGEIRRAHSRVFGTSARRSEWSEAMNWPADKRGMAFALRGFWPRFPVSPEPFVAEIAAGFKTRGYYTERASFSIARRLDRYTAKTEKLAARGRFSEALALLRAVLTVAIEVLDRGADDSFGVIGESFQSAFKQYLKLPLEQTGVEEPVFFHDLLTLLIWEDYGLTFNQTERYFARLTLAQGDLCIAFLRQQMEVLRADDLERQTDEALSLLSQVAAEQRRFEMFEALAREMGSGSWKRILCLADAAVKARKSELAGRVFDAALRPGAHLDFLRKHYERLKNGAWDPWKKP